MKGKCYPAYSLEKDKLKKVVIYRNRKQWNYQENLQHDHLCLSVDWPKQNPTHKDF